MHMLAVRFAIWLIAMIAGAIYTIIQTGPDTAGQNLCKLIQKAIPSTPEQCVPAFQEWGPSTILLIAVVFVVLIVIGFPFFGKQLAQLKVGFYGKSNRFGATNGTTVVFESLLLNQQKEVLQ
jgi:hypothetical protein